MIELNIMALKVKVAPKCEYLEEFLDKKGLDLVEEYPQILHYVGSDVKDMKDLYKIEKPDLLVTHAFPAFDDLPGRPQVYYPLKSEAELLQNKKAYTNSFSLCKTYLQRIGLQAEIITLPVRKKRKAESSEVDFRTPGPYLLNLANDIWRAFRSFMLWR